jgi:diguanylate cyclase (GGDEF)-like protein
MKILLVEDDEITVKALEQELTSHHYTIETTADGQRGLELACAFHYDLLLLDIILPKLDGISLCRQVRSHGLQMPILLLSAKDSSAEQVMGLEAGADDYVVKPYELNELIARIQALLRRGSSTLLTVLTWEKLQLDPDACQVTYDGKILHLTPKEYKILELFLRNPRRIFSRSAILDHIWLSGQFPQEDAVSTQIKGLRQKLKAAGITTDLIETMYGLGYRLKAPPEDSPSRRLSPEEVRTPGVQADAVSVEQADKRQAQAKVLAAVQRVWNKFKESFGSKIALFEQAIALTRGDEIALAHGDAIGSTLDSELLSQAQMEAHRLIGSLGTFGLKQGSEIARQIEQLLRKESLDQNQLQQLEDLVGQLKQAIENKSFTTTAASEIKTASGRLLIIDDDLVLTQQVKQQAIAWGLQVEVATDPTTARKAISSHPPDVILLDLTFSQTKENGLTLLAELTKVTPSIPVLVMTGKNQLSDRVEVARLGGQAFLQKPMTPEEILKAVTGQLNRTQKAEAKVLIVDDDRQMLTALSTLLQPWGLHITTLEDPQQFLQILEATTPDLLILDIEMPGFSGIELCQVVRNDPRWSDLPVLFLSGHNDAEIVHQVFAVGADDYVQKPIVGPELIARILNRLERSRILHRFAETDELTSLTNRRKSIQDLERLLSLAERQHQPLCFMILDLDNFKRINDKHGHEAGDRVLCRLGEHLKQSFRREDVLARWGGEEFVLGLYGISKEQGVKRLTDFLDTWRQQKFLNGNNQTFHVTFSAGVAEYSQDGANLQELYRAADAALYRAKAMGRNRVMSAQ